MIMKKKIYFILMLVLAVAFFVPAEIMAEAPPKVYSPSDVPNVNVSNRYKFVSDPAGYLDAATLEKVNKRLWDLRQQTSVEPAVVIVPSIGDMTVEDFTRKLFDSWKIGKSDKDNGLLFLLVPEDK